MPQGQIMYSEGKKRSVRGQQEQLSEMLFSKNVNRRAKLNKQY